MTLATRVVVGFGIGLASGIFFGELAAPVGIVGDAFIGLLQMTVLPYVMVSLILGLGRMSPGDAGKLFKRAGVLLLVLWAVAMSFVLLMPFAYPDWEAASPFSTSLVEPTPALNLIGLFIPVNPFRSLAAGVVPGVVLFSLAIGAALMGVAEKRPVLHALAVASSAISRVAQFVVELAPFGVFAVTARAAGTLDVSELEDLQVYLATYLVFWLVMGFWVLPGLVSALTPLRYREMMGPARDAFVTAFATGSVMVVLPILAEHSKRLVRHCAPDSERAEASVDVLIPLAFTFPGPGALFIMGFVLFAGWMADVTVSAAQLPGFLFSGLLTLFGHTMVAVPFMLDLLHIPADLFQLYVVTDVFTGRFGMLLSAVFIMLWSALGAVAVAGAARVNWRRVARLAVGTVVLVVVGVLGVRFFFTYAVSHEYTGGRHFLDLTLMTLPVETTMLDADGLQPPSGDFTSTLDRIRSRGALRVGYLDDVMAFSFRNAAGEMVGHDIDLAHTLARDLGVRLELVPVTRSRMAGLLTDSSIDTVMSGIVVTADRATRMEFSSPYMNETLAFVVPDHNRNDFTSREAIRSLVDLTVGVPDISHLAENVEAYLGDAKVVVVSSPREFFEQTDGAIDALVYSAEGGSAWCLMYPAYSVVVPESDVRRLPVAFPVASGDDRMRVFLDTWIELKRRDGTLDRLYDHWILAREPETTAPRWSVIRDVLHWVD